MTLVHSFKDWQVCDCGGGSESSASKQAGRPEFISSETIDVVLHICNLSNPTERKKPETGDSPEV